MKICKYSSMEVRNCDPSSHNHCVLCLKGQEVEILDEKLETIEIALDKICMNLEVMEIPKV